MDSTWDLDDAAWARLHQLGGNKLALELVDIFLRHTAEMLAEVRAAYCAGNFEPIERAGHTLKSNCVHLGAVAMREIACRLECAAAAGQSDVVSSTLQELENAFACVSARLEEKRRTIAA